MGGSVQSYNCINNDSAVTTKRDVSTSLANPAAEPDFQTHDLCPFLHFSLGRASGCATMASSSNQLSSSSYYSTNTSADINCQNSNPCTYFRSNRKTTTHVAGPQLCDDDTNMTSSIRDFASPLPTQHEECYASQEYSNTSIHFHPCKNSHGLPSYPIAFVFPDATTTAQNNASQNLDSTESPSPIARVVKDDVHHQHHSQTLQTITQNRKLPLIVVIFDQSLHGLVFKMFNGRHYLLKLERLKDRFMEEEHCSKMEAALSMSSWWEQMVETCDLKQLWEHVNFHELLMPCADRFCASNPAQQDNTANLISLAQISLSLTHHGDENRFLLPLHDLSFHPQYYHFQQDLDSFELELSHYETENLIEPQLILHIHALTGRISSSAPHNMRDIYNSFKQLLKSCSAQASQLHHYFMEYTQYADHCVGLLLRAWLHMCQQDERSKYQAYTLLNQIKLDHQHAPKQTAFVYFSLGRLQRSNGEAINLYTKAIELDPINTYIYNNRASRYKQTSPELSIQDYTAAIELDPTDPYLYYNRGILYKKSMQDIGQACRDFTKSLELDPSNVCAYYFRALLYHMHLNEYQKALEDYNAVIRLSRDQRMLVKAHYSRGSLYTVHLRQPVAALEDFDAALRLNPKYDNALFNRKFLLVKLRKYSCIGNV